MPNVTPPEPQVGESPHMDHNNPARARTGTPKELKPTKCDYAKVQDRFLGASTDITQRTFKNTTQCGKVNSPDKIILCKHLKAPHPALNTPCRNKPVVN